LDFLFTTTYQPASGFKICKDLEEEEEDDDDEADQFLLLGIIHLGNPQGASLFGLQEVT
jgi:hypothetical protein